MGGKRGEREIAPGDDTSTGEPKSPCGKSAVAAVKRRFYTPATLLMPSPLITRRRCHFALTVAVGLVCLLPTGCVRRRLTVRTNPPGALVYVDDQEIGVTPAATPFVYYGTRKIQIFADGYEPLTVKQPFPAPWYQIPPLDFFFDNLWPWELRDEREVHFELQPQQMVANENLIERAEMLRGNTQAGLVTPLPATVTGNP